MWFLLLPLPFLWPLVFFFQNLKLEFLTKPEDGEVIIDIVWVVALVLKDLADSNLMNSDYQIKWLLNEIRSGDVKSNPPFSILGLNIMLPHNHIVGLTKQLLWAKCVKEIPHPVIMMTMTMMNTEMKIILMIMVMILMTWPPSVQWAAVSTSLELICKHGDGEELRKGGEDDDKVKEKRKLHWWLEQRIDDGDFDQGSPTERPGWEGAA